MLRATHRFTVWVAQVPELSWIDQATDELAVDVFGTPAGRASSTAHPAASHDGGQASPSTAVHRVGVLRVITSPTEVPAALRAVTLVLRERLELTPAPIAVSKPEGATNTPSDLRGATDAARGAELLIPV